MKSLLVVMLTGVIYGWSIHAPAQTLQWDKRFGGNLGDSLAGVLNTADGGYLLFGDSRSGAGGDRTQNSRGKKDFWAVKVSASGAKQWDKRFGGINNDYLHAAIQTRDGGYLLGGASESGSGGDKSQASRGASDFWVVKISSAGAKQWDKRFGGAGDEYIRALLETSDGGFLLGGASDSASGGDKSQASRGGYDCWTVKITSAGVKQWDRRFGGTGDDGIAGLAKTADGGYLLTGGSNSGPGGDKSQAARGGNDFWVVKISSAGAKQWDKCFGGTADDWVGGLVPAADGGFLLGGHSSSPIGGDISQTSRGSVDYWVVKINASGFKLWDRRFGGTGLDILEGIAPAADGGFALLGWSMSGSGGDKSQLSRGASDFWIVKISATGAKQWDKRFGGARDDEGNGVVQTPDGGYLLGGDSNSGSGGDKSKGSRGDADFWIVKLSGAGTRNPDAYEPDDSRSAARKISNGHSQKRSIHAPGNVDWSKFVVGSAGARKVRIQTAGTTGDTQLWLCRADGAQLDFDDDSGTGSFSLITQSSLAAGTYYVKVAEYGNDAAIPAYTLKVIWSTP